MQAEPALFQITITEQGKKFIRKFAAISPLLLILVVFEHGFSIYWNIKAIGSFNRSGAYIGFTESLYYKIRIYTFLIISVFTVVSNIYYLRFPRVLLRCIETNDEPGANKSFSILFKGAFIYLFVLVIGTASVILSFLSR